MIGTYQGVVANPSIIRAANAVANLVCMARLETVYGGLA